MRCIQSKSNHVAVYTQAVSSFETDLNLDVHCDQSSSKATTANRHCIITETSLKSVTVAFPIQLFAIMQTVSSRLVPTDVSVTGHPTSKIGENDLLVQVFNIKRTDFRKTCVRFKTSGG